MSTLTAPICRPSRSRGGQWRSPSARPVGNPAGPARLTRRGRLAVTLLLLALAVAVIGLLATSAAAGGQRPSGHVAASVTVRPGETLWQIALTARPDDDPRVTVERIREMNGLDESPLQAGQALFVPSSG